jgi:hypothetical protein
MLIRFQTLLSISICAITHWRRGDKCGGAARPGAPHKLAGVTFDSTNGSATALLCSDYADAEVGRCRLTLG